MVIKSKRVNGGLGQRDFTVEIREVHDGWWGLYVDGDLKQQSADHDYIEREYDRI